MKAKFYAILMALIMMVGTSSCMAQGKVFKEVAKLDGVTAVYISKSMLRLAAPYISKGIGNGVISLSGLEVVTCENKKSRKKVEELIEKEIQESGVELWMAVQQPKENMSIYAKTEGNENIATQLFLINSGDELQIVNMKGKFDLEKISLE